MRPPSDIPREFYTRRDIKLLVIARRDILFEYAERNHRLSNRVKERKNTRKRKKLLARLRPIERDLIIQLAQVTRHPDLFSPEGHEIETLSKRLRLIRQWTGAKRPAGPQHPYRNRINRARTKERHFAIKALRALEDRWLVALESKIFRNQPTAPLIKRHPRFDKP